MRRLLLAGLMLAVGCSVYRPSGEGTEGLMPEDVAPEPAAFRSLREAWLANRHAAHPTRATLRGVRAHDARLPDLSPEAVGARLDLLRRYRARLDRIDRASLSDDERREAGTLDAELRGEIAALERERAWERNPDHYREILAEGIRGLLDAPFESLERRLGPLTERLEQVPAFLAQARRNLVSAPRTAVETALETFAELRTFVEAALAKTAQDAAPPALASRFGAARGAALAALREFEAWMRNDLLPRSGGAALPGDGPR